MGGKAILSQVLFEKTMTEDSSLGLLGLILGQNLGLDCTRVKIPEYTDGYLLGDHKTIGEFMAHFPTTIEQSGLTLEFIPKEVTKYSRPSHDRLPIHYLQCPPNFSTVSYFENLKTRELGRLVIYADVLTSTNDALTGHSLRNGLVVIARRQTSARGRGKNIWLSPEGCVPFSFQLQMDLNSGIGRRISLVQHIAALAIVLAVPSHKEIDLRVKWPNDVYLGDKKVAGIIVESTLQGKSAVITIGIGVNVSNTNPTTCLNAALDEPLSFEVLVARVLTEFEAILDSVDGGNLEAFLDTYVENWIHNPKDAVNVEVSEGKFATCHLVGLDEYGFLRVEEVGSGHILSVRPDGNSFDITNKLIAIKQ
jgi:biotin--protein ligase